METNSLSPRRSSVFWASFGDVFKFYFFLGTHSRRPKLFFLLALVPVAMAVIFKSSQLIYGYPRFSGLFIYSNMIMMFFLQFLILLLTLFFGTSICGEEVEGKTLPYIVTRPLNKTAFLLGKYAAYTLLVSVITLVSLTLSFIIMNLNRLGDFKLYRVLLRDGGVLLLGIWCYAALFTFLGVIFKKAIFFGLLFSFGWENVIQYFPGKTQKLAIVHYLKSLLPPLSQEGFPFLLFRLEPTPRGEAILILLGIMVFFLGLSCALYAWKEFIIET